MLLALYNHALFTPGSMLNISFSVYFIKIYLFILIFLPSTWIIVFFDNLKIHVVVLDRFDFDKLHSFEF